MTVLSAVVATAGLLLDSAAVVVGSMVIAPQVASALTASVGTVLDDRRLVGTGFREQAVGLAVAMLAATAFGWLLRTSAFVPQPLDVTTLQQISQRISSGLLSLAVSLSAGSAGAVGLATALPVSLVGVMVAAALIPATAAVGVGIAWGYPGVAAGAFLLVVVNASSIALVGAVVLWLLGYHPEGWQDRRHAVVAALGSRGVRSVAVLAVVFPAASVPLAGQMSVENDVNQAVETTLDDDEYASLELLDVQVSVADPIVVTETAVTVVLSGPDGGTYPDLARRIAAGVTDRIERPSTVEILFRDRKRARAAGGGEPNVAGRSLPMEDPVGSSTTGGPGVRGAIEAANGVA